MLLSALPVVAAIRVGLWLLPSRRLVRMAARLTANATPRREAAPAETVVWAVEAASRFVPAATCLTQAIAAYLLLRRQGHTAQLCLGVGRAPNGSFRAHAWLEQDGRILIGGRESRALTRLPLSAHADRSRPWR